MASLETHTLQSQKRAMAVMQPSIGRRRLPPIGTSTWTQRSSRISISSIESAYRSSSRPTISAAAIASASVHPLETVFSASALIRALTRVSSLSGSRCCWSSVESQCLRSVHRW